MRTKLTPRGIESAAPAAKPYEIRDTERKGLILRVQPSGVRSFIVEWGRGKRKTLGQYPVITLAAARTQALAALGQAAIHGTPDFARRAPRVLTFAAFVRDHFEPWALAHQKQGRATLDALKAQFSFLDDKPLADITAAQIEKFKTDRLKAGMKPATVNRDLDRIRGALSRAVDFGLLQAHPLQPVKRVKGEDNTRVRYLSDDEEKALRKALAARDTLAATQRASANAWRSKRDIEPLPAITDYSDHLTPLVLVALNTGLRRGELFGLTWENVNLDAKRLTVAAGTAKSRRARHIPLNLEAVEVLRALKPRKAAGLVFPGEGGGRLTNVNKSWAGIVTAAELDDFRFHDLRHTFASKLVMRGVDLNTVRELLGHSDIKMTLRYAHLAPDHLADAVSRLAG